MCECSYGWKCTFPCRHVCKLLRFLWRRGVVEVFQISDYSLVEILNYYVSFHWQERIDEERNLFSMATSGCPHYHWHYRLSQSAAAKEIWRCCRVPQRRRRVAGCSTIIHYLLPRPPLFLPYNTLLKTADIVKQVLNIYSVNTNHKSSWKSRESAIEKFWQCDVKVGGLKAS